MSSEEQRQKEEAASRRHAKLDNAGVLHMSTQAEIPDKITIVSPLVSSLQQVLLLVASVLSACTAAEHSVRRLSNPSKHVHHS